ncbi:unnamed protein product [Somion occarium]|uniref:DUF6697 domain-containing protein n=1 Tax=Somion occarium TaxID=3059160 RepID=A0ABP1CGJ0_9APHY
MVSNSTTSRNLSASHPRKRVKWEVWVNNRRLDNKNMLSRRNQLDEEGSGDVKPKVESEHETETRAFPGSPATGTSLNMGNEKEQKHSTIKPEPTDEPIPPEPSESSGPELLIGEELSQEEFNMRQIQASYYNVGAFGRLLHWAHDCFSFQPHAKVKKDSQLDFTTVLDRLKLIGTDVYHIELPDEDKFFTFNRLHITTLFGGNFVSTFPKIDAERVNSHGIDNFAFLNLDFNPHAPMLPGAPGLCFVSRRAGFRKWDSYLRLFIPFKGDHKWCYMGNYMFLPGPSLSIEEYAMQRPQC